MRRWSMALLLAMAGISDNEKRPVACSACRQKPLSGFRETVCAGVPARFNWFVRADRLNVYSPERLAP